MAKYEDYVKQEDELSSEIADAAQKAEDRQEAENPGFELPERFKGKTPEEIAASYLELEKAYSRQGNDLGKMRQTMDEYIANLQSDVTTQPNASEEVTAITIDDLYDDPEGAVARAAEKAVGDRVQKLEQELAQARLQTRIDSLGEKFGDWQSTVASPEFLNWVQESPYRLRVAQAADQFDLDAAEEILALWTDRQGITQQRDAVVRDQQLADASLESSTAGVHVPEHQYSRSEIMNKRIAANHGDQEAASWLRANAEGIAIAYEEGNLTD